MKNIDFIQKLKAIDGAKTVYMWGTFGQPVTESLIAGKARQYPSWYTSAKCAQLRALIGKGYFAFDCVGMIKGLMWGWTGSSGTYGGAVYKSNGVPDTSANGMIALCSGVSTNFSSIEPGEAVWIPGHIGIYIGNGEVIETTPAWENGTQTTKLSARKWEKHGKLPFINYIREVVPTPIVMKKTTENLNMRTGPGTTYGIVLTIPAGSEVQVLSAANGWALVSFKGKTGHCAEQYLTSEIYQQKGRVVASVLNVRSGPGTAYRVIGQLTNGQIVEIISTANGWHKIRYGTREGFVSEDYIDETGLPSKVLRGKVYNCNTLYIRKAPGGSIVGSYKAGEIVTILEKVGAWYRTDKGYSSANYIAII